MSQGGSHSSSIFQQLHCNCIIVSYVVTCCEVCEALQIARTPCSLASSPAHHLSFFVGFYQFLPCWRGQVMVKTAKGGKGELRTRNALHMHCAFATVLCTLCCNVFHCFQFFFPSFFVTPVLCVRSCVVYFVCSAGQQTKLLVLFLLNFVFFWLMPLTVFCFHSA